MRLFDDWPGDGPLEDLRHHWGDAYDIRAAGGVYTARRRDGKGDALADPLPEGLRMRIAADYRADRVPRDLPPQCLRCGMPDPPPEETCTGGRDHRVGTADGCPGCGRVAAACATRPCSAARVGKAGKAGTTGMSR
jgi:hypothetical protein